VKLQQGSKLVPYYPANVGYVHCIGGGLQLLVYLLQCLEMYDVWLVSCTVRTVEQEVYETHYHLKLWALYSIKPHMCTTCLLT